MAKLKSVTNNDAHRPMNEVERLEAVKDLLFGENIADYKRQFSQLRDQINQNHHQARQLVTTESTTVTEKLDALEYRFEQSLKKLKQALDSSVERIESMNTEAHKTRNDLGKALGEIAEKLQK